MPSNHMNKLLQTNASGAVILIRLVVGGVFLSEGIQKFLYPAENGAGRFARIGIPSPDVMGPFVGVVEIVCGTLIVLGLLTRLAAIPLIINMLVAVFVVHGRFGFFMNWGGQQAGEGIEFHIVTIALLLMILVRGSGTASLDLAATRRNALTL